MVEFSVVSTKRKRRKALLVGAVLFLFGSVLLGINLFLSERKDAQIQSDMLSQWELDLCRSGDVILRQGFGMTSEQIALYLNEKYTLSHCGILLRTKGGKLFVIHSLSDFFSEVDGVQISPIESFCQNSMPHSLLVTRALFADPEKVSILAKDYLQKKIPFDHQFDLSCQESMYCSELLWTIFREVSQLDVYPVKSYPDCLYFSVFYDTSKFEVIVNHQKE